jgi:restriction system protein
MSIPEYQAFMKPLLEYAGDGKEHRTSEAHEAMAAHFNLSKEEMNKLLPSGAQAVYKNRVGWAKTYMSKAGLLELHRRGFFRITARGKEVLSENPATIDNAFLTRFSEFNEFRKRSSSSRNTGDQANKSPSTPEETIEAAINCRG